MTSVAQRAAVSTHASPSPLCGRPVAGFFTIPFVNVAAPRSPGTGTPAHLVFSGARAPFYGVVRPYLALSYQLLRFSR